MIIEKMAFWWHSEILDRVRIIYSWTKQHARQLLRVSWTLYETHGTSHVPPISLQPSEQLRRGNKRQRANDSKQSGSIGLHVTATKAMFWQKAREPADDNAVGECE